MLRKAVLTSLLAGLVACASAPVQEMSDARQAIAAARAAGATARAPDDFQAAQAAMTRAESHLQLHEYSRARVEAVEAKRDATAAIAHSQPASGS